MIEKNSLTSEYKYIRQKRTFSYFNLILQAINFTELLDD
jgi:hypothetical protein